MSTQMTTSDTASPSDMSVQDSPPNDYQAPSSGPDEFADYRFFLLPIPPCSRLAPYDALYEFEPPQSPHSTMLLLVRWINVYCAPVLPEELDLGPLVLRKVPEERFAMALEFAQNTTPLLVDPVAGQFIQ